MALTDTYSLPPFLICSRNRIQTAVYITQSSIPPTPPTPSPLARRLIIINDAALRVFISKENGALIVCCHGERNPILFKVEGNFYWTRMRRSTVQSLSPPHPWPRLHERRGPSSISGRGVAVSTFHIDARMMDNSHARLSRFSLLPSFSALAHTTCTEQCIKKEDRIASHHHHHGALLLS